jgi:hypothetical protein
VFVKLFFPVLNEGLVIQANAFAESDFFRLTTYLERRLDGQLRSRFSYLREELDVLRNCSLRGF